jgi:hypothetical protein
MLGVVLLFGCPMSRGRPWDGGSIEPDAGGVDLECGGDPSDDSACVTRGASDVFLFCEREQEFYRVAERDCTAEHLVCVDQPPFSDCDSQALVEGAANIGCAVCRPCARGCNEGNVARCLPDGSGWEVVEYCQISAGEACENGYCVNGCDIAERVRSNVGCEYMAVDLDNAVDHGLSAASQQFAVVVSNPSTNAEAIVTIEQCNQQPCSDEDNLEVVAEALVNRRDLEVFELDAREVDGSPPGTFNTGTGTAIGPQAYRITSSWPIVAYQFNPLENVGVFSNDASLLLPTTAMGNPTASRFVILGWPQTIANAPGDAMISCDQDFPAFLTIVGVQDDTTVRVHTRAPIVPSGERPPRIPFTMVGETLEMTIDAFDVLNLETGLYEGEHSFLADFTGSVVEADGPVVVFSGVEATDVPIWADLSQRQPAADHLEEQMPPAHTLGNTFAVGHSPRRTQALAATGAVVTPLATEPEWFRIIAAEDGTVVETTVPGYEEIELDALEYITLESDTHFIARSNLPIALGQFVAGQNTTGIPWEFPGGDPAYILIPPIEQWRTGYVFLTPDKYMFDYLIISVDREHAALVEMDGVNVATMPNCWRERGDGLPVDDPSLPDYYVITCALSAPVWDPDLEEVVPGVQNDVPHEIYIRGHQGRGIGITVYGFDNYVSYGYTGGTDLRITG